MIQTNNLRDIPNNEWLLLGVGNPILGDDGVGIYTAHNIEKDLPPYFKIDVREESAGGLDLVEQLMGYHHVILIDSIIDPKHPEGSILDLKLEDFERCKHAVSPHTMGFFQAWQFLQKIDPLSLPSTIKIIAITIKPVTELHEGLSPRIQTASQRATNLALDYLTSNYSRKRRLIEIIEK